MTDLDELLEQADETCVNAIMLTRSIVDDPGDAQVAVLVTGDESFEGPTIVALGTVGTDQNHVAVSLSGFISGQSTKLSVMELGDEIIVTVSKR